MRNMDKKELYKRELDCRVDVIILDIKYWEWQADHSDNDLDYKFALSVVEDKIERLNICLMIKRRSIGNFWFID